MTLRSLSPKLDARWPEKLVLGPPTPPDWSARIRLQPFSRPLSRKPPHRDGLCRTSCLPQTRWLFHARPVASTSNLHPMPVYPVEDSIPAVSQPGHRPLQQADQTGHRINSIQSPGCRELPIAALKIMHGCITFGPNLGRNPDQSCHLQIFSSPQPRIRAPAVQLFWQARAGLSFVEVALDQTIQDMSPRQLAFHHRTPTLGPFSELHHRQVCNTQRDGSTMQFS